MVQLCDFCGDQRSMVYCQSDNACLCFSCDRSVHFANPISWRHLRTLVCQRCNSQPAIVRCVEDKICLCQNCYWIQGHKAGPASSGQHRRQEEAINCYSGCPSAAELSTIWSFDLEFPSVLDNDDHALCCEQQGRGGGLMGLTDKESVRLSDCTIDQDLEEKKMIDMEIEPGFSGKKGTGIGNDDFFIDFNMDDIDLSLENFEQLFGPDNLFENEDVRVAATKTECAFAFKVHSATNNQAMHPAYRDQVSADSVTTNCNSDPTLCVPLSFAGPSGGCSGGVGEEYREDCKVSAMLPYGEPPLLSGNRENAVLRYMEKKKTRNFDNKTRYASRKARADTRKRAKGRFVKAGIPYDYDPLSHKY